MAKLFVPLAILLGSLLLNGCSKDETAEMPKNDPVIGKPVDASETKSEGGNPEAAAKGTPLSK